MRITLPSILSCSFLSCAFLLTGCVATTEPVPQTTQAPELIQPQAVSVPSPIVEVKQAAPVTDVWHRISRQITFDVPDHKLVNYYRQKYIKNPRHLAEISKRAQPFMLHIVEKIEARGLPIELALLPIVESAFDPFAYSHGAASGLWQFTSPMAKHFGLHMNWWYDGRRDVPAATTAALDMMQYLHKKTKGNWLYAIAAYNTGEGRVLKAIKKNKRQGKPTDFWALDLPKETEHYVPQLIALADVIKNAKKYGIQLTPIDNQQKIAVVDIGSQIDLAFAAELADMSIDGLHRLNPGYNRWATSPDGPHRLVLPVEKVAAFKTQIAQTKPNERLNWLRYKIKPGDSIGVIAKRYHTNIAVLRSVNNISGNTIVAGRHLLIPVAAKDPKQYALTLDNRHSKNKNRKRANFKIDYQVKSGDSLWKIAKNHKVKISQLAQWNNITPKTALQLNQKLVIWANTVSDNQSKTSVMRKVNYKVRSGDSLARIASKFNVTVNDLLRWNSIQASKYLQPGQMLKLFVDVTKVNV
ncbi:lytic transglycosylase [Shewanella gelidii]|uniref:lytic transglycosylase n=1 Tax=Shewanella gelidii TaxID=1642821 RepID=UPI001662B0FF|nr:LysM peptidoglycan-binding domain-containing protein [Shewanella gelidii]MCL1098609.1 LysM peptidoglycan-binding domain-containing protein [Shewanella gelidii]